MVPLNHCQCLFNSTFSDPLAIVLEEDLVVPAKHEVVQTGRIRNSTLSESVLEPNVNLSEKGVLVARVIVQLMGQKVLFSRPEFFCVKTLMT